MFSDKAVVLGQKGLLSGKSSCYRAKVVNWGKVVVFGQKWFYSGKVAVFGHVFGHVFGQRGCIPEKVFVVVFGQNWLYSGKVVVFGQK